MAVFSLFDCDKVARRTERLAPIAKSYQRQTGFQINVARNTQII